MSRAHRPLRKLGAGLLTALALLGVVEITLRVVEGRGSATNPAVGFGGFRDLLVELGGFTGADRFLAPDPELFWRIRPSVGDVPWQPKLWIDNRSNSLGMRDPERTFVRAPDELRLLCLGDSCTYGSGVRMADSWPQRLEELLAAGLTDRVVGAWNAGVPGWSSDQGAIFLAREGPRIRPDLVTVAFGLNDARHWDLARHKERGHGQCRTDRTARAILGRPVARLDRLLAHLALYRALARLAPATSPDAATPGVTGSARVPEAEFRENLATIAAQARRLGAKPVFLVWPIRWQIEPQDAQKDPVLEPPTVYQQAMRQEAARLDVPLLDLVPLFEKESREQHHSDLYVDSVHMNVDGCRRVAAAVARFLHEQALLPPPPAR